MLWHNIQPHFENKTVSIHNQETIFEDEFFLQGTGDLKRMYEMMNIDNSHHQPTKRSSLQSYFDRLIKAKNILLVHNTFIKQEDIDYVKLRVAKCEMRNEENSQLTTHDSRLTTFFCLCVNANLFIENSLPPVELLMKNDCNIVLGTDSLASNWSLSILDEIKTITKKFPQIPTTEIFKWVTINGAKALDMDRELGSFEKGKMPGVVLIEKNLSSSKRIL
jgi:cytosine/adenosine deaminase-related metal-dependent hydrolase